MRKHVALSIMASAFLVLSFGCGSGDEESTAKPVAIPGVTASCAQAQCQNHFIYAFWTTGSCSWTTNIHNDQYSAKAASQLTGCNGTTCSVTFPDALVYPKWKNANNVEMTTINEGTYNLCVFIDTATSSGSAGVTMQYYGNLTGVKVDATTGAQSVTTFSTTIP